MHELASSGNLVIFLVLSFPNREYCQADFTGRNFFGWTDNYGTLRIQKEFVNKPENG